CFVNILQVNNTFKLKIIIPFLDSERSDECIDFTMLCFFFCVSLYTRTCRNINASISNCWGGFL
ncbi:Uncharacterized protein FWK35_00014769, partial [Aphis craccivora]